MPEIPQSDIDGWKILPLTQEVFKRLKARIAEIEDNLGSGATLNSSSAEETLANTAREVGRIEGIKEIFEI